jgi:hypothetical protein
MTNPTLGSDRQLTGDASGEQRESEFQRMNGHSRRRLSLEVFASTSLANNTIITNRRREGASLHFTVTGDSKASPRVGTFLPTSRSSSSIDTLNPHNTQPTIRPDLRCCRRSAEPHTRYKRHRSRRNITTLFTVRAQQMISKSRSSNHRANASS